MNIKCVKCGDVWAFSDYYCDRCESHAVEETRDKPNTKYIFFKDKAMKMRCKESDPQAKHAKKIVIATGRDVNL